MARTKQVFVTMPEETQLKVDKVRFWLIMQGKKKTKADLFAEAVDLLYAHYQRETNFPDDRMALQEKEDGEDFS